MRAPKYFPLNVHDYEDGDEYTVADFRENFESSVQEFVKTYSVTDDECTSRYVAMVSIALSVILHSESTYDRKHSELNNA